MQLITTSPYFHQKHILELSDKYFTLCSSTSRLHLSFSFISLFFSISYYSKSLSIKHFPPSSPSSSLKYQLLTYAISISSYQHFFHLAYIFFLTNLSQSNTHVEFSFRMITVLFILKCISKISDKSLDKDFLMKSGTGAGRGEERGQISPGQVNKLYKQDRAPP